MAKKKETTEVVNWEAELEGLAQEAAQTEVKVGGGEFISTKGGEFSYRDTSLGDTLSVVIIDSVAENQYYESNYDPDSIQVPVCFSFSRDTTTMVPHEASIDPQHSDCTTCPQNQYGSANVGKGKACKNVRRLALILEDDLTGVEAAEIVFLKVSVTSVKAWSGYVNQLNSILKRPPLGVVTTITVTPDPKTQFKINFEVKDKIMDGDLIRQLLGKKLSNSERMVRPYEQIEIAEPPKKSKTRRY